MHHSAIAPFKDATERCSQDLTFKILALELDHLKVTGKTHCHLVAKIVNQSGITGLKGHEHGYPEHLRLRGSIPIAGDHGPEGQQALFRICAFSRQPRLKQKKIGIKSKLRIFIRRLHQFLADFN